MSKTEVIDSILANTVYTKDSGLLIQLRQSLQKLSRVALSQLHIIIDVKISDAENKYSRPQDN